MNKTLSAKTIAARARTAKYILPPGADNAVSRYYTGGAQVNHRPVGTATAPSINVMNRAVYKLGDGECACSCGHRPGCSDFLALPSVGEAD